jgi:hypothetical protein
LDLPELLDMEREQKRSTLRTLATWTSKDLGLGQRDFLTAFWLWIVLEFLCFWLAPTLELIEPGDRLPAWFIASLGAGIGGAILIGIGSHSISTLGPGRIGLPKLIIDVLGQATGGLGLAGVMFPLMMVILEFIVKVSERMMQSP